MTKGYRQIPRDTDPGELVRTGYDRIGIKYQETRTIRGNDPELLRFAGMLPKGGRVLDACCGTGIPASRYLADAGFQVTGVDFSREMLRLARENVPEAEMILADVTKLELPDASFDGIVSLYSIIHIPRERHGPLIRSFFRALRPGGVMMITMARSEWEEVGEFCGERMFWSQFAPEDSLRLVEEAGFVDIDDWLEEPEDWYSTGESHYWIIARKPSA